MTERPRITDERPFTGLDQLSTVEGLSATDVEDIRNEGRACV